MKPRCPAGSTLSVHRAFVVHLGTMGGSGRSRFCGRVEHLSSGQSARFASLKDLLAFFAAIVDGAVPGAPQTLIVGDPIDSLTGQRAAGPAVDSRQGNRERRRPTGRRQSTTDAQNRSIEPPSTREGLGAEASGELARGRPRRPSGKGGTKLGS